MRPTINLKFNLMTFIIFILGFNGAVHAGDKWAENGFEPAQAECWQKTNFEPPYLIRFSLEEAVKWKNAGIDCDDATRWKKAGFSLEEAIKWKNAGIHWYDAPTWKEAGFSLDDAIAWKKAGIDHAYAPDLKKAGFSLEEAIKWKTVGIGEAPTWKKAGCSLEIATTYKKAGVNPYSLSSWTQAGCSCEDVIAFKNAGFAESSNLPYSFINWKNAGFTGAETIAWKNAGFDKDKASEWKKSGFAPGVASFWVNRGTIQEAQAFQTASTSEQFAQLVKLVHTHPEDNGLRSETIKLWSRLNPKPDLPEDAERYMARGRLAIKEAQSTSDFSAAAAEFQKAVDAAPWFPDAYYNLAIALSKAADYSGATKNLKLYLLSAPEEEAKTAKTLMYQLEYKADKADNEKCLQSLRGGGWYLVWCAFQGLEQGCTEDEINEGGANFMYMRSTSELVFPGNGTVELPQNYLKHIGGGVTKIIGTPKGIDPKNIQWDCEFADGRSTKIETNYSSSDNFKDYFNRLTCDRGSVSEGARYHYARLVRK